VVTQQSAPEAVAAEQVASEAVSNTAAKDSLLEV